MIYYKNLTYLCFFQNTAEVDVNQNKIPQVQGEQNIDEKQSQLEQKIYIEEKQQQLEKNNITTEAVKLTRRPTRWDTPQTSAHTINRNGPQTEEQTNAVKLTRRRRPTRWDTPHTINRNGPQTSYMPYSTNRNGPQTKLTNLKRCDTPQIPKMLFHTMCDATQMKESKIEEKQADLNKQKTQYEPVIFNSLQNTQEEILDNILDESLEMQTEYFTHHNLQGSQKNINDTDIFNLDIPYEPEFVFTEPKTYDEILKEILKEEECSELDKTFSKI